MWATEPRQVGSCQLFVGKAAAAVRNLLPSGRLLLFIWFRQSAEEQVKAARMPWYQLAQAYSPCCPWCRAGQLLLWRASGGDAQAARGVWGSSCPFE